TTGCLGLRSTLLQKCVTFCDRKGLLLAFFTDSTMVLHHMLRLLIATYFGLVSEEGFIDLCNDSLVSKDERCIYVEDTPAAELRILALQHSWWPMSDTSIFRTTGT
ncbi:hypothetical protein GBAR_LOCUS17455, partial [Geodia barretti]